MEDLYRDQHGGTKVKKQRQTREMPRGRQTHALTSMLNNQLWHLQDRWKLFLQPPARSREGNAGPDWPEHLPLAVEPARR